MKSLFALLLLSSAAYAADNVSVCRGDVLRLCSNIADRSPLTILKCLSDHGTKVSYDCRKLMASYR